MSTATHITSKGNLTRGEVAHGLCSSVDGVDSMIGVDVLTLSGVRSVFIGSTYQNLFANERTQNDWQPSMYQHTKPVEGQKGG